MKDLSRGSRCERSPAPRSGVSSACFRFGCLLFLWYSPSSVIASDNGAELGPEIIGRLAGVIQSAIDRGSLIGAQLVLGTADECIASRQFGLLAPGSDRAVDRETMFCIGSCSKPLASFCLMTLIDEGTLSLDDTADRWIAGFGSPRKRQGLPVTRAPTVRELLAHRGGVYSQKQELSALQQRAIRDWRLTLAESVAIITRQPLRATPGSSFAYSGAGYCVLGRIAELGAGECMDQLLQTRLCKPLRLQRTTYFPGRDEANIAVGGTRSGDPTAAPHLLGGELRLALVGGGLYSTAEETGAFARMILNGGRHGPQRVLSAPSWSEFVRRQFPGKPYGLGWTLRVQDGETVSLRHFGALYSYRSMLFISLAKGYYVVAHWTLVDPNGEDIRQQLRRIVDG